jgi:predicted RNA-binding Zn-ribbon protein involved in translation (DUF1610 family)
MKNYSLTCKTETCINKDIAIELATDAEAFICGPCGQEIASVVEIAVSEPTEPTEPTE